MGLKQGKIHSLSRTGRSESLSLRKRTKEDELENTPEMRLKVMARAADTDDLKKVAQSMGLEWTVDSSLFGGRWRDCDGNSYLIVADLY